MNLDVHTISKLLSAELYFPCPCSSTISPFFNSDLSMNAPFTATVSPSLSPDRTSSRPEPMELGYWVFGSSYLFERYSLTRALPAPMPDVGTHTVNLDA